MTNFFFFFHCSLVVLFFFVLDIPCGVAASSLFFHSQVKWTVHYFFLCRTGLVTWEPAIFLVASSRLPGHVVFFFFFFFCLFIALLRDELILVFFFFILVNVHVRRFTQKLVKAGL